MLLRRLSETRSRLAAVLPSCARMRLVGLALLASLAGGCGGQSSTDTGNPPVSLGQKLRLTATETGVRVSGEAGSVGGGARVDVLNTATGQSATTTAAPDGSFELEMEGSVDDEFQVYYSSADQSWRTTLTSSGLATPEMGLDGRRYLLSSADGYALVPETTISLSFSASEVGFRAGCNSKSGSYSLCEGRLCVPSPLSTTDRACGAEIHAQEQWVADFLHSSPTLTQAGAALTLTGAEATLDFLDDEIADPDRPLTGRTWGIHTWIDVEIARDSQLLGITQTVEFRADGSFTVYTGCNSGFGNFTRNAQTLTLASVTYNEEGCAEQEGVTEAEIQRVLTDGEVTIEINAARLTIMRGEVGLIATTE